MCTLSIGTQRLIVEECLKYAMSILTHSESSPASQMVVTTQSFWKASEFSSCRPCQTGCYDLESGERSALAREHHIPDDPHELQGAG